MKDLDLIFKAYDVRGVVPDELDTEIARATGAAFVQVLRLEGPVTTVVTAHDMRTSSEALVAAFAEGVTGQGVDVIEAGLAPTDLIYFAAGSLDLPGAVFTASHNPGKYGGIKLCRAGAAPVGQETGLRAIRDLVETFLTDGGSPDLDVARGSVSQRDLLSEYADYVRAMVPLTGERPLTVVVDAGNGMGGHSVPTVLGSERTLTIDPLFFELDGTFPHHEANPIDPANLVNLQARVREIGADVGLAFDGDADRCFIVDERGEIVAPSTVLGLIADRELAREPGATVIHNLITSMSVPEIVTERGGTPVRTRVGHSFIKGEMARTGAIVGGEHSGHFYFREFWKADSGMLAALHVLAALGESDAPLSELLAPYHRYSQSGEINSTVTDAAGTMKLIEESFGGRDGAEVDHLDGLTIDAFATAGWWANVRSSNTEPLLRLNAEAREPEQLAALRDELLAIIRGA